MPLQRFFGFTSSDRTALSGPARVPEGVRVYAVGDIHGRSDLLDGIHRIIARDLESAPPGLKSVLVYLGDYVDRGPDSRGVIDRLLKPLPMAESVRLKGNHESMMQIFLETGEMGPTWYENGGRETAISYGVAVSLEAPLNERFEVFRQDLNRVVPYEHMGFLNALTVSHKIGDYVFVHAGINPDRPLSGQREADLLWIRDRFLRSRDDFGVVVVHGHSITDKPDIRRNRIGIDTGAYATGILTCLVLEGDTRRILAT